MKKCINAWCFDSNLTLDEKFALAKESNYDAIEVNMEESDNDNQLKLLFNGGTSNYSEILELSKKYNLPISSISTGLHWKYSLTSNDVQEREKGKQIVKQMIDAAKYLNCDAILVVPGTVSSAVAYDVAYDRALEAFKELRPYAEENKISIGIENVWNKFLVSPREMAHFIDKIGGDFVKSYFDVGNILLYGYPEQWIKILGNRIVRVHVKDFVTSIGNMDGFVPLLQGDVNWSAVVSALKEVSYDGYITAELSPYKTNPSQLVRDTSAALDYIISL